MNDYILFHQTTQQLRRIGARGGRASGRNRRARLQAMQNPVPPTVLSIRPPLETTAQAIATRMLLSRGYGVPSGGVITDSGSAPPHNTSLCGYTGQCRLLSRPS